MSSTDKAKETAKGLFAKTKTEIARTKQKVLLLRRMLTLAGSRESRQSRRDRGHFFQPRKRKIFCSLQSCEAFEKKYIQVS
jgi:hypothetical protein